VHAQKLDITHKLHAHKLGITHRLHEHKWSFHAWVLRKLRHWKEEMFCQTQKNCKHWWSLSNRSFVTHCNTLQQTATNYNTLLHTAPHSHVRSLGNRSFVTHCNTPQHSATHCNTLTWAKLQQRTFAYSYVWHDSFICVTWRTYTRRQATRKCCRGLKSTPLANAICILRLLVFKNEIDHVNIYVDIYNGYISYSMYVLCPNS